MSTLYANPLGSDRCHTRCRLHVARGISLPDMLKRKLAMSIERFEAVVDRMTELHGEQDAADAEDTAENAAELESLRLERRDLEARLGDRLNGIRGYRGSPG